MDGRYETYSVCPVCLRTLPARRVEDASGDVFLVRACPEHGEFRELVWEGFADYGAWGGKGSGGVAEPCADAGCGSPVSSCACGAEGAAGQASAAASDCSSGYPLGCPHGCESCSDHLTRPCCVLLEVTRRCNLRCPVCFAQAGGDAAPPDPSLDEVASWYDAVLKRAGHANIQLSGGEPTMRDDLPQIIGIGRDKGFTYFQINTNGLRIASEAGYARALKAAGASCVFLQFDGVTDDAYRSLRGRPLLAEKRRAIEACAETGLPVVLVPTVAAGVNDGQLGDIVRFAMRHAPTVRGVHIQPLARFGRVEGGLPKGRITIPGVLAALDHQTAGMVSIGHFQGGSVESPLCSFSASYRIDGRGTLIHVPAAGTSCCGSVAEAGRGDPVRRARAANAMRWGTDLDSLDDPAEDGSLDAFLQDSRRSAFSITGMAFMDADTLDLERLRRCYIFIMDWSGTLIPFCTYNLHREQ